MPALWLGAALGLMLWAALGFAVEVVMGWGR